MDDILFELHMTWPMWRVAAIVSNNDYSEHVRGQGFSTNVDVVQKIRGAAKKSEEAILANYCSTVSRARGIPNLTPQRYQHAVSIFIRLEEDIQETSVTTNRLDQELADMIKDVETFKRLHRMQSAASQQALNPAGEVPKAPRRPHETYMSSNKLKITMYNMPEAGAVQNQGTSASAVSKKKTKKKSTKRKRKTLYNSSSRRARQDTTGSTTGRTRILRTLGAQVKAGLRHNGVGDEAERDGLAKTIVSLIRELVYIGNEATRCAQQALAYYFAEVIAAHPTLSPADVQARRAKFSEFSGTSFVGMISDQYDQADLGMRPLPTAVSREFSRHTDAPWIALAGLFPTSNAASAKGCLISSNNAAFAWLTSSKVISRNTLRNLCNGSKLKTRNGYREKAGRSFAPSTSRKAPSKQMTFLPESGLTDSFVHITERHLIEALYANPNMPLVFGEKAGDALNHLTDHPGDLTYRLFFSPRLKYLSSTVLTSPDEDCAATSGKALLSLVNADQRRYQALVLELETPNRHVESRALFKAFLGEHLQTASGNKESLDQGEVTSKYALTGTICTNGHELQVIAYGLTKEKPPSTPPPNTTRAKIPDACEIFTSQEIIKDLLLDLDYVIIGIDPGICSTATATVIDTRTPGILKNVSVSQGSQRHCTKTYLNGLQRAKRGKTISIQLQDDESPKARNIEELESTITPVICSVPINEAQGPSWLLLSQSLLDHVQSLLLVQEHLRNFYTSRMFQIKGYHRKTAIKATLNRAVDRIIGASGLTEKWDPDKGPRPIFVVGDDPGTASFVLMSFEHPRSAAIASQSVMNKAVASSALAADFRETETTTPPRTWPGLFSCSSGRDAGLASSAEIMTWSPVSFQNHKHTPKRHVEWLPSLPDSIGKTQYEVHLSSHPYVEKNVETHNGSVKIIYITL
ncbi:hypothetical protein BGZ67_004080 [Mortierella alpina]|nr:hypothetical protein BGZ67_004080 [Mortierella alpina]